MESKESALGGVKSALGMFRQDLEALPEEVFARSLGGKARSVADIAYEINLVNDHVGRSMTGEPLFDWPKGWITAPVELQSKEAALAAFDAMAEKTLARIVGLSQEALEAPITTEHGPTNGLERCRFLALHLWYHSGQLNFVQTLIGDDKWHWS